MTFAFHNYSPKTYNFTGFSKGDLNKAGLHGSVSCGDTFKVPDAATLCFSVQDDDKTLSGGIFGYAADLSYQKAKIALGDDGPEQGNGHQVYAAQSFWLQGPGHTSYLMIEIRQEGSDQKYYTFHDSYGVPSAGEVLTVVSNGSKCGTWIDYANLGAGDCAPYEQPDCITVEAEDMALCGYKVEYLAGASGGAVVTATSGTAYAKTEFKGTDGVYDLKLSVVDESDGRGYVKVYVNGQLVSTTRLDQNTGGVRGETGVFREISIEDISLDKGDVITIKGIGNCAEYARIDKLEICKDKAPVLGAVGDLVFLDADRDGIQDAGEAGVAGITVLLKGGDGTVVAQTITAADGSYLFDKVAAGNYSVAFVLPSEYVFTAQNIGGNDAIDSDANPVTGATSVFTLAEGESNLTLDAGIVVKNTAPTPADDAGGGCADEPIAIDVLANDSDPDGDTFAVHAVNGIEIIDGQTIDIGGVSITLIGGVLTFDGGTAFAALDIGESQTVDYSYTVKDEAGATSDATVSVTYCGDANSLGSLSDSLPNMVSYQLVDEYENGTSDAFTLKLDGSGDARIDGMIFDAAYCVSALVPATGGPDFTSAPSFTAALYLADPDMLPADIMAGQTGLNGQSARDNLDLINWILNQDFTEQGYTDAEVQAAIWNFTDSIDFVPAGFGDLDDVHEIVALASANGEGFVAGDGDLIGLIVDPSPETESNMQPFIVGIAFDQIDCLC